MGICKSLNISLTVPVSLGLVLGEPLGSYIQRRTSVAGFGEPRRPTVLDSNSPASRTPESLPPGTAVPHRHRLSISELSVSGGHCSCDFQGYAHREYDFSSVASPRVALPLKRLACLGPAQRPLNRGSRPSEPSLPQAANMATKAQNQNQSSEQLKLPTSIPP